MDRVVTHEINRKEARCGSLGLSRQVYEQINRQRLLAFTQMDHDLLAGGLPSEGLFGFLDYLEAHSLGFPGRASKDLFLEQAQNFRAALLKPGTGIRDFRPVQANQGVGQFIGRDLRFVVEVSFGLSSH